MGEEIETAKFREEDFEVFYDRLRRETEHLKEKVAAGGFSRRGFIAGLEVEAWLINDSMRASPSNEEFLEAFNEPLACPELARFNIELNNHPLRIENDCFSKIKNELELLWQRASNQAETMQCYLMMVGILPTIKKSQLNLENMSPLNRYRALNEQILKSRGRPINLEIVGKESLKYKHNDVMLESAATSFQLHLQAPIDGVPSYYNASIMTSFAMVAVSANSPFLFNRSLWEETRIPLFEQAIETGGYRAVANGPLRRVSFGSGYVQESLVECFQENLEHFPVLLPRLFKSELDEFHHLRIHNGSIWRWNRPLLGFDPDGTPHFRVEHRVIPAGPTITDMVANAVFFYGLANNFAGEFSKPAITFSQSKDNFYQAARHGLAATVVWQDDKKYQLKKLILEDFIPRARSGLVDFRIDRTEIDYYLSIIRERVESGQTGAQWQQKVIQGNNGDFTDLTRRYLKNQQTGKPVHQWK